MSTANLNPVSGELKSTKNDIHLIVSSEIIANESLNERGKDNYGDIDELVESIREHGVQNPLHGYREKAEDGRMMFHVTHGFRRSRAIAKLLAEGIEIKVPCLTKKKSECSEESIIIAHFTLNSGMHLSTIEKANAIKKLSVIGYETSDLAKKLSMTETYINNLLALANAPMSIKKAVESGKISGTMAMTIVRENKDPEKAVEIVKNAISEASNSGKEKATNKHVVKSGGSKKAVKRINNKNDEKAQLLELMTKLAHKYNMSDSDIELITESIAKV